MPGSPRGRWDSTPRPSSALSLSPRAVAAAADRAVPTRPAERAYSDPVAAAVEARADGAIDGAANGLGARATVECRDGTAHEAAADRFSGHPARPVPWEIVSKSCARPTADRCGADRRAAMVDIVRGLAAETAAELFRLLD